MIPSIHVPTASNPSDVPISQSDLPVSPSAEAVQPKASAESTPEKERSVTPDYPGDAQAHHPEKTSTTLRTWNSLPVPHNQNFLRLLPSSSLSRDGGPSAVTLPFALAPSPRQPCYITVLSHNVLLECFCFLVYTSPAPILHILQLVCSTWRRLILCSPTLWATLEWETPYAGALAEHLRQSRDARLDISIHWYMTFREMVMLRYHTHCIRALSIGGGVDDLLIVLCMEPMQSVARRCKALILWGDTYDGEGLHIDYEDGDLTIYIYDHPFNDEILEQLFSKDAFDRTTELVLKGTPLPALLALIGYVVPRLPSLQLVVIHVFEASNTMDLIRVFSDLPAGVALPGLSFHILISVHPSDWLKTACDHSVLLDGPPPPTFSEVAVRFLSLAGWDHPYAPAIQEITVWLSPAKVTYEEVENCSLFCRASEDAPTVCYNRLGAGWDGRTLTDVLESGGTMSNDDVIMLGEELQSYVSRLQEGCKVMSGELQAGGKAMWGELQEGFKAERKGTVYPYAPFSQTHGTPRFVHRLQAESPSVKSHGLPPLVQQMHKGLRRVNSRTEEYSKRDLVALVPVARLLALASPPSPLSHGARSSLKSSK
ncbi:hypothetical protein C8F01DRAFT_1079457 [Mycena amicta]|nr:hypothetical protein C8F01DRAFT_1079457 [Mycena amicta]